MEQQYGGKIVYLFDWRQVYSDIYRIINERISARDYKTAKMLIISNVATFLGFLEYPEQKAKEILKQMHEIPETDIYKLQYIYSVYAKKLELGPIAPKSQRDSFFDRIVKKVVEKYPDFMLDGLDIETKENKEVNE